MKREPRKQSTKWMRSRLRRLEFELSRGRATDRQVDRINELTAKLAAKGEL
jgi:hypothetical protein